MASPISWLTARPYAHRGLHDGNREVPENSRLAAKRAMAHGFGIECDLQLSEDGVPIVFHDDTLERLTTRSGDIRRVGSEEIAETALAGTSERIPTFAAFLQEVAGEVPLLVELKGRAASEDEHFVDAVASAAGGYDGPIAFMSFDAHLVRACRDAFADRPVGLTADGTDAADLERHGAVAEGGIDFVSYDHRQLGNAFVSDLRRKGVPILCWTIRSADEARSALGASDQITFEGFVPEL